LWFEKIFSIYNRNLFRRRFHSFRVSGLENLKNRNAKIPLIVYANHSSWWDGLAAFEISQAAQLDFYVMMEEKQLKNLQLFRKLGAFSVVRENPREAVKSLNYSVKLLNDDPRRTLWIFPQGTIESNDQRPFKFFKGLSRIVEKVGICEVVSCAMRFEFLGEFKPEIFVRIGAPETIHIEKFFNAKEKNIEFENEMTGNLDQMKNDLLTKNLDGYKNIF
jgi:chlorobactene lauroyltransferase